MCGIAGIINFKSRAPSTDLMQKMLDVLAVRGPDDSGQWSEGRVLLGHRRLAILDLSKHAQQPMIEAGVALVFNGTIYNHAELRQEMESMGDVFKSSGDTEVILKAYLRWGLACVPKLIGMFAFAVWDGRDQNLHLVRDRFGIKPLYYAHLDNRLVFASNPKAILQDKNISTELDTEALHFHFSLHAVVPAPATILKSIRKVKPAHILSLKYDKNHIVEEKSYWQLNSFTNHGLSYRDWEVQTMSALQLAIKRRIENADVSVGVLLSGGIDSSLLVGILAQLGVHGLQTFSIGFENDINEKGDEFEYSDCVANYFSTNHHKISISNNEVLNRLPEAIEHMAEPMFAQDAIAFYLLSEQVSKSVKVVQSGQGADELFGGYFWYPKMLPTNDEWSVFHKNYVDRDHAEFSKMLAPKYQSNDVTRHWLMDEFAQNSADSFLNKVLNLDISKLIVDDPVKRVDNMTMAWGLEARVPFLDHELVELVAQMPSELKLSNGGKGILKSIAKGVIPDKVINRSKAYFPMPALKYVRGEFLEFMRETLLSSVAKNRGLYQTAYVEKLLQEPTTHFTRINGSKLWHMALSEYWLQRHGI